MEILIKKYQIRLAQLCLILRHPLLNLLHHSDTEIPKDPRNIIILRLDHIGDFIMSEPAFSCLRQRYPHAHITVICGSWNKPVTEMMKHFDEVITLNAPWHRQGDTFKEVRRMMKSLSSREFDLGIALRQWLGDLWLLSRLPCHYTLGYAMYGTAPLLSQSVQLPIGKVHFGQLALNLLSELGVKCTTPTYPQLNPTAKGEEQAKGFLESTGLESHQYIGLHLTSREAPRSWYTESARELIELVHHELDLQTVLFGGNDELGNLMTAFSDIKHCHIAAGITDIQGSFSIMKNARAFVGIDSGPAHLAAASGVPTVVLWSGQTLCDKTSPRGNNVKLLRGQCTIAPCYKHHCPIKGHPCMRGHTAEDVFAALKRELSRQSIG